MFRACVYCLVIFKASSGLACSSKRIDVRASNFVDRYKPKRDSKVVATCRSLVGGSNELSSNYLVQQTTKTLIASSVIVREFQKNIMNRFIKRGTSNCVQFVVTVFCSLKTGTFSLSLRISVI